MGLRWASVNLDARTVLVEAPLVATKQGLILKRPKTDSGRRVVNLDDRTVAVLRVHQKQQQELAEQLGMDLPEMVFPRLGSEGRCHPNTWAYFVKTVVQQAGCPGVTMRSLRHFHASMALQEGQNPKTVPDRIVRGRCSSLCPVHWATCSVRSLSQGADGRCGNIGAPH